MDYQKTKREILESGLRLWPNITLKAVAEDAGTSHPNVLYHFPNGTIKDAIAQYAVEKGDSRVIVQLIGADHPAVAEMDAAERTQHFMSI